MNIAIEKGTKIIFGKHRGEIEQHFLETGKLNIALENGSHITKTLQQLMKGYNDGLVKFGEIPTRTDSRTHAEKTVYIDMKLTDEQRAEINRKKAYVESCWLNGRLLDVHDCDFRVREVAVNSGDSRCPTARTVRKWAHRYLACNSDPRALLERRDRRGNRKPRLTEAAQTLLATTVKSEHQRRNGLNIKQTWELINREIQKNQGKYGVESISYKAVRAYVDAIPPYEQMVKRKGYKKARNEFPSGFMREELEYLLERVELDQTQLNLYVVDPMTGESIGRPWLTMGIDVTSGMIVWFHLSLKRLDGNMLPRILYMAMRPKDMNSLRKQYPELKSDWPVHGVFEEIVLDNSMENHTHNFQTVCSDTLHIQMHYVPPAQGSLKPHIERLFGSIKTGFTTKFAGSYTKDDEDKYALRHAVVTMEELVKQFTIWVVDNYHNKYQDRLAMTPLEKWRACIELHGSTRLPGDVRDLEKLQWNEHTATLQKFGLQYECLQFKSPALMTLIQKLGYSNKISFYIDPYDLSSIRVVNPTTNEVIEAACSQKEYRQNTVTLEQHKEMRRVINADKALRAKEPEAALSAAFDLLHNASLDSHKRSNAKVRKAKARKAIPTSDKLMNGTTNKPKPKKTDAYAVAPWLSKKSPKYASN